MSGAADLAALTPEQRALLELRLRQRRQQAAPGAAAPDAAAALRLVPQPLGSGEFVLSFSQLRMWFVDQLESGSAFYNVASAVRLSGAFDRETLRRALDEVVVRHESLRTTFALRGPEPVQIIGPPRATRLPLVDLRAAAPAERDALARRHAAQLARQPFDLARGPLLRLLLVRLGDAEHVLVCVTHHIVSDWWSQRVLVRDLAVVYGALARGLPSPLPPLPVQYRDFAVWQRGWLRDGVLAEQLAYWRSRLAGAPTQLMLPLDRPRPAVQSYRGGHQLFAFRRELPAAVGALARQQGCTPFTVLFAAFQVLLCHRTGQEDLVISAPVSYRNSAESEGVIGFFVNTLLLRADLTGNPGFRALLARVYAATVDDLSHQHLPLERLIEALAPQRSLSHSPYLQVGINYAEDFAGQGEIASNLGIVDFDFEPGSSQFELNLILNLTDENLFGSIQYRTDLFTAARIDELIAQYRAILEAVVAEPDVDLARLRGKLAADATTPTAPGGFLLSPQQERLWAANSACRALCLIEATGEVEAAALGRALCAVVARHEILRTTFQALPGQRSALQVVGDGAPCALRYLDLAQSEPAAQQARLTQVFDQLEREPLDLARGPALTAAILTLAPGRQVLCLCLPALCADAPTLRLLVDQVALALGAGFGEDEPIQFADVAQWQNDLLAAAPVPASAATQVAIAEAGMPHVLSSSPGAAFAPRSVALPLALPAAADVQAVLLAGWQTLLQRLADPAEVATGVRVSGRGDPGLAAALGPLARYLPLPPPASGTSFTERVAAAAAGLRRAEAEQDLAPAGGAGSFSFCFDFDQLPAAVPGGGPGGPGSPALSLRRLRATSDRFRLKLAATRQGGELAAELCFDAGSVLAAEAERLGGWLAALLGNALEAPDAPAAELSLLTPAARRQVLGALAGPRGDWGPDATLPRLCWEQARRTPHAVALAGGGRRLTYAELDDAVARLAARLAACLAPADAVPDARIALAVDRSPEMVVAILAIQRAGAAYVPLDPDFPPDRLRFMLEDSRAALLVSQERHLASFAGVATRVLCLAAGEPAAAAAAAPPAPPEAWPSPADLAYVIYTSGSTGRPKGVMVSHGAIANRVLWMRRQFPMAADDVLLQKTPYGFDASIWEIFLPLICGARLAIAEPGGHRDAAYLAAAIAEHGVTVLQLVPSQLAMLLEAPDLGRHAATLRRLFCGGEALPGEAVRRFRAAVDAPVCNLYGPTETAIDATFHLCPAAAPAGVVPIGLPLDNLQVYVLDRGMQPVPPGLPGELYVGGVSLARGYLMRPRLTAERFVPHPWSAAPGERLYRTGDQVRCAAGGVLEFLGRGDGQVKVRGVRIELGEIEAALARHPQVAAAVATVRDDAAGTGGERQLVAYFQAGAAGSPAPRELREHLLRTLPEAMVPAVFVELPALPLAPSGKVDRQALPRPGHGAPRQAEYVAPRTAVEQALATIWEGLLGVGQVGAHDNFFDLGGHSLQGMRLVSHVRDALGVELRVRSIFENPTLAGLAQVATDEMVEQLGEELVSQLLATGAGPSLAGGESA